jgi:hypothetical protein
MLLLILMVVQAYFENASITAPEIRRGLNSVFANDLVPDATILDAAIRASRRVNDYATYVHGSHNEQVHRDTRQLS